MKFCLIVTDLSICTVFLNSFSESHDNKDKSCNLLVFTRKFQSVVGLFHFVLPPSLTIASIKLLTVHIPHHLTTKCKIVYPKWVSCSSISFSEENAHSMWLTLTQFSGKANDSRNFCMGKINSWVYEKTFKIRFLFNF